MTPDKDIQKLFDAVNTPFADNDAFLSALSQRLEKVEYVKRIQDAQIRRYKVSVIYSLIAGLVVGVCTMAVLQTLPTVILDKISSVFAVISRFETDNPIAAVNMGIALLTGSATFLIARNFQEIYSILSNKSLYGPDSVHK